MDGLTMLVAAQQAVLALCQGNSDAAELPVCKAENVDGLTRTWMYKVLQDICWEQVVIRKHAQKT